MKNRTQEEISKQDQEIIQRFTIGELHRSLYLLSFFDRISLLFYIIPKKYHPYSKSNIICTYRRTNAKKTNN